MHGAIIALYTASWEVWLVIKWYRIYNSSISRWTHDWGYCPWLVNPESLDHLEHIHHSLCLATVNGSSYRAVHTRAGRSVTGNNTILNTKLLHKKYTPAMDHNRLVSSPPLNLYNLLIDVSYNLEVCTCTSQTSNREFGSELFGEAFLSGEKIKER